MGTPEYNELHHHLSENGELHHGLGRTAIMQGCFQIACVFVTMAVSIAGGVVTGT